MYTRALKSRYKKQEEADSEEIEEESDAFKGGEHNDDWSDEEVGNC